MDFWVWLIIVGIAWLLEALASANKKKKERPPAARRTPPPPPPARRPPPAPPARRPAPRPQVQPQPRVVFLPPALEAQAEETQIVFEVPVARAPRPRGPEIAEPLEGVTAEEDRVEPAAESTDAQHVRATAKYGPSTAAVVTAGPARNWLVMGRGKIKDAILWTEILGRPKGDL